jgi:DNA-binding MurR/RpiR family transcriptional regulator
MAENVAERIADRIETMPPGERKAAQTLVANYPLIGLKTVADFAAKAGVSAPTILRFISRLGFQHYSDFQAHLQEELAAQLQSPLIRSSAPASLRENGASPMVGASIQNIRETFRHISTHQTAEIVDALANPRMRITLVGGRFTDPLARYMAAHLTIIRPNVFHLAGQESNWRDRLIDMGKRDILVILDIRRYQESLVRFAEKAGQRGVSIILFTDQWLSPIARFARYVVAGRTAVPSAWDSSAALFVMAETLIAEVTRRLEVESARRIGEMENLRDN